MKDLQMYINGQFCNSSNGQWIAVLNPSTEEVISRQPDGTIEDVNRALDAARAAQKAWAKTPAIERAGYLLKMAEGIRKREKEFTEIIMREQGKTRAWASIEVGATIAYFEYMATFARHIEGEIIPSDRPNETILLTKKPIGVVAGILHPQRPSQRDHPAHEEAHRRRSRHPALELPLLPHCPQGRCCPHRRLYHRHQALTAHARELYRVCQGRR